MSSSSALIVKRARPTQAGLELVDVGFARSLLEASLLTDELSAGGRTPPVVPASELGVWSSELGRWVVVPKTLR